MRIKFPFWGIFPGWRRLFRSKGSKEQRKAIIIMVKAEVVDPGGKKLYTPDTSIPDEEVPAGDASLPALSNAQ